MHPQECRVDCYGYFMLDGTTDPQPPDENLHLPLAPAQPGTSKMHPWCYLQTDRNPGTLTAVGLESWTKLEPIYLILLWMLDMESLCNFRFRILQSSFCEMLRAHEWLGYHQFGGADNLDWSYCWRVHPGLWLNLNSSQGHEMVNHKKTSGKFSFIICSNPFPELNLAVGFDHVQLTWKPYQCWPLAQSVPLPSFLSPKDEPNIGVWKWWVYPPKISENC